MGSVFLAEQTEPVRRQVALKLIRPGMASQEVLNRFQAERQALALMDHENIAKVLDAGNTSDGQLYFVMEYVPGVPITQFADQHKLPLNQRLELFVQVCRALQHAHQKGIIHRDIKPSNVLVREADGRPLVKVIDFGLAKTLGSEQPDQTVPGQIMGTYQYMSPEQAGANVLDVDTRTDVYSLGVLLYELLTGSTPLEKGRLQQLALLGILKAIREEEPQRPSSRLSTLGQVASSVSESRGTSPQRLSRLLSRDLDWITLRALEKDRNRRYDGPAQLAEDVLRFLRGDAVEATPPSLLYRLQKAMWRNRAAVLVATLVLVLLAAGLISTTQQMFRALDAEETAENRRLSAESETKRAQAAEALALEQQGLAKQAQRSAEIAQKQTEKTLARSDYFLGVARIKERRPQDAANYLDRVPLEYREFEWNLARQQVDSSQKTYFTSTSALGFSPDGSQLRLWSRYSGIRKLDLVGTERIGEVSTSQSGVIAEFLPDGKHLVMALRPDQAATLQGPTVVAVVDADTGREIRRFPPVETGIHTVKATDGATLVGALCQNGPLTVWETSSGQVRFRLPASSKPFSRFAISPNGAFVATLSTEGKSISLWNGQTGAFLREVGFNTGVAVGLCFSPNGRYLAASSSRYSAPVIQVWDLEDDQKTKAFQEHSDFIYHMQFSPDGLLLASCGFDRTIKIRNVATGELACDLVGHNSQILEVQFNPTGSQVASREMAGGIKVWDLTRPESTVTVNASGSVTSIAFHPNGKDIALGHTSGYVDMWDMRTGRQQLHQHAHQNSVPTLSYSDDGLKLVSAGWDGTAVTFDAVTREQTGSFTFCDAKTVNVVINDGATLLAATRQDDSSIEVWDTASQQRTLAIPTREHMLRPVQLALDFKGERIAAIDGLSRVCVFDGKSGQLIQTLNNSTSSNISNSTRLLSFGRQEQQLLASNDTYGMDVWDLDRSEPECRLMLDTDQGFQPAAILHPFGKRAIAVSRREARIMDLESGEVVRSLTGVGDDLPAVACSRNGELMAVSAQPMKCVIYRAANNGNSSTLSGHASRVSSAAITPDGHWIASGAVDGSIIIWDRATGEPVRKLPLLDMPVGTVSIGPLGGRVACVEFSIAVTGSEFSIRGNQQLSLLDVASGIRTVLLADHKTFLASLAFSPDERFVAAMDGRATLFLWDAANGELLRKWESSSLVCSKLAFSTDGQWIQGIAHDNSAKFWNVSAADGSTAVVPDAVFDIRNAEISSDGRWQVSHLGNSVVITDLYAQVDPEADRLRRTYWHMRHIDTVPGRTKYSQVHHACCLLELVSQSPETLGLEVERYFHTKSATKMLTDLVVNSVIILKHEQPSAILPVALDRVYDLLTTGADFAAAKYVLSTGGRIRLHGNGQIIRTKNELPLRPIKVATIDFRGTRQFTEDGLAACANLPDLEHLDFVATPLTDAGLRHFAQSHKLVVLDLVDAPIGDFGLQVFDGITTVQHLWLGGTRTTDEGARYFRNCTTLLQLDLRASQVTDAGLTHFSECPQLISLFLSRTNVTDNGLAAFRNAHKLTRLDLSFTKLSDAGLANFTECSGMVELSLVKTNITDACLDHILKFKDLKILRIGDTQLSEASIAAIREQLPQCRIE